MVGAVEIDPLAVETYRHNHRRIVVWDRDIAKLPAAAVMSRLKLRPGQLDLLAGCPPCQGFSTLTTLNGRIGQDERNDLIFQFLRFVRILRPKAVMMENVPKLAKNHRFKTLRSELQKLGYVVNHSVLDAANYGVPQRRRRLILVAGRGREIPFGSMARIKPTVRQAFARLGARARKDPLHNLPENRSADIKRRIGAIPKNGGSRLDLGPENQLPCHDKCDGFKDVFGRMAWDEVSPTITGGCFNPLQRALSAPRPKTAALPCAKPPCSNHFPPATIFQSVVANAPSPK